MPGIGNSGFIEEISENQVQDVLNHESLNRQNWSQLLGPNQRMESYITHQGSDKTLWIGDSKRDLELEFNFSSRM